jgi:hypothetical protein
MNMKKLLRFALLAIALCLAFVSATFAVAQSAGHGAYGMHHARQVTTIRSARGGNHHVYKHHRRIIRRRHHRKVGASIHLSLHN